MALKYKLTYFNCRGTAELIRVIFAQAGVEYEDVRIEMDNMAELIPTPPFGKVPTLEFDGITISESRAIARYIARENGLAGKDNIEAAQSDMLVDAFFDLFPGLDKWIHEKNVAVKTALFKSFCAETLSPFLASLNSILENNGGRSYLIGDKLTWADTTLAIGLHDIDVRGPSHETEVLENHPLIKAYIDRILELPNIKAWLKKRPVSDF